MKKMHYKLFILVILAKAWSGNSILVKDIVTNEFFNGISDHVDSGCEQKGFFTRTELLKSLGSFPQFGAAGSEDDSKREIAAFFAHVTHDATDMCSILARKAADCQTPKQHACTPDPGHNWMLPPDSISRAEGLDDRKTGDKGSIGVLKSALQFWMSNCHDAITNGRGFGATIRAINGRLECDNMSPNAVGVRVQYYRDYCTQLHVDPGNDLWC